MTKSGRIGTRGETGVARFLADNGFPLCERRRLRGNTDGGDLVTVPGLVVEVKAGAAAKDASLGVIDAWMAETEAERRNACADIGILVVQRRGYAPSRAGHWRAIVPMWAMSLLLSPSETQTGAMLRRERFGARPIELELGDLAAWLRRAGYGDPIVEQVAS